MKQKRLLDILYVFDVNPYEITQDTDVTTIKVQEESYKGFVEMNQDLAEKIVRYNYHVICVNTPEWAPYVDQEDPQEQITFGIYGSAAEANVSQVVLKRQGGVVTQWTAGDNLSFPFQTECLEDDVVEVHLIEGVDPANLNITGNEYINWGWVGEDPRTYTGLVTMSSSISIGIDAASPSTHEVVINSDIAMAEIMEQTSDHQTIVNTYTSPSSPFTMTVNGGNIVTVEFDNGKPFFIYNVSPIGFFAGQWENPDTGKYISWSEPISDDVNVTIQQRTYTVTLSGTDILQNATVKMNGETVSTQSQYQNVSDGTVVDVYPTQYIVDYSLISGAVWDTDHWTATVNGADLTITIDYLGDGVNFNASWYWDDLPENVSQINVGNTSVTGNDLTDGSWTETVRLYPGTSQVTFFVSTGLPTDMTAFKVDFKVDEQTGLEYHYAYKQTDPDTGEPFYSDAADASGNSVTNPGIWTYDNTPETGLPWIAFTLPSTDKNGNAFPDNTEMKINSSVSSS